MSDTNNEAKTEAVENNISTPTDPAVIKAMEKAQAKIDKKAAKENKKGLSESQINELLSSVNDSDVKVIAQLLLEIKRENDRAAKYAKRQSILSLCSAVLCLILVATILIWGVRFVPTVEKLANEATELVDNTNGLISDTTKIVNDANSVLADATDMLDETAVIVTNLDKITSELAENDLGAMMENVNELVIVGEESMIEAADKIESIDIDTLNKAIKDLQAVVTPLSRLFKK